MKTFCMLLFVLCCYNAGFTQSNDPYFIQSRDTFSKYAPDHITREILQDKQGNMWFATWMGIIKYDGKIFTNYTLKDDLVRFHIVCCYEDSKGRLWFGTARAGAYCYDGKAFRLFTTKDGLVDNNIGCIAEDKAGNIWLGTEHGASRYDGRGFTNFTKQNGFTGSFVNSIMQDRQGKIWLGATQGLYSYDGKSFAQKTDLPFDRISSLLEDRAGNIWVGGMDGLVRYNKDQTSFTRFLGNRLTYYMIEDKTGNIWLTHSEPNTRYDNIPSQVLYKYDGKTFIKITEKDGENDFQLFGKTMDRNGNLWFGTMHGPCKYDGKGFTYFTK